MTRRRLIQAAARIGVVALGLCAWPLGRAQARAGAVAAADARIAAQRTRLERLLPPETLARCRRVAAKLAPEIGRIPLSSDWEHAVVSKVGAELEAAGEVVGKVPVVGQIIGAILAVIAAVLILIGQVLAAGMEDEAAGKEKRAPGKDGERDSRLRALTWQLVERLEKSSDAELSLRKKKP